jgi:hypothetical protein
MRKQNARFKKVVFKIGHYYITMKTHGVYSGTL